MEHQGLVSFLSEGIMPDLEKIARDTADKKTAKRLTGLLDAIRKNLDISKTGQKSKRRA